MNGRALSRELNIALKQTVAELDHTPGLAVVLVGEDPASQVYVRRKGVVAERLGIRHQQINLDADVSMETLLATIDGLNDDPQVDGILVQLPLPKHLDANVVTDRIRSDKDADGLHPLNVGQLGQGRPSLIPCTPNGVMLLLERTGVSLEGLHAVVLGRSNIVGRPMAMLLEQANCTVTVCHSRTKQVEDIVRSADVVVVAIGRPESIRGDWIKPGAVVVDVGINRLPDGRLVGDVAFDEAMERAAWVTPVPGGVGPMTIAMLMRNTVQASRTRHG
jgi:methylenetetrahydrofolate dehydrogenase (NADP+)/methenyltetrahydrofolate cyclohydrolase